MAFRYTWCKCISIHTLTLVGMLAWRWMGSTVVYCIDGFASSIITRYYTWNYAGQGLYMCTKQPLLRIAHNALNYMYFVQISSSHIHKSNFHSPKLSATHSFQPFFSPGNLISFHSSVVTFFHSSTGIHPIYARSPKPPIQ